MSVDLKQIYKRLLGTMWVNKPLKDICVIPQPTASASTSGTVFPNTDRVRLVKDIFFFFPEN